MTVVVSSSKAVMLAEMLSGSMAGKNMFVLDSIFLWPQDYPMTLQKQPILRYNVNEQAHDT